MENWLQWGMENWWWVVLFLVGLPLVFLWTIREAEKEWRERSWEGAVVGKYEYDAGGLDETIMTYAIELCHNQTVKTIYFRTIVFPQSVWESIEIGDYVVKKSGSESIEKRALQDEEAREVTHILTQRLCHVEKEVRSLSLIHISEPTRPY